MSEKRWTKKETEDLIEIFERHPIMWDKKYSKRATVRKQKQDALEKLSVKFCCDVTEIKRKLHNLRNQV